MREAARRLASCGEGVRQPGRKSIFPSTTIFQISKVTDQVVHACHANISAIGGIKVPAGTAGMQIFKIVPKNARLQDDHRRVWTRWAVGRSSPVGRGWELLSAACGESLSSVGYSLVPWLATGTSQCRGMLRIVAGPKQIPVVHHNPRAL